MARDIATLAKRYWPYVAPALVFIVALVPRAVSLGGFLTEDEGFWIVRSEDFYRALAQFDWGGTFMSYHPGVVTMWLSGFTLGLYHVASLLGLADQSFTGFLAAGSLAIAVAVSALIVAAYFLMRRLFSVRVAVAGALFMALDPFLIAHSRVIHLDALVAMLMTLAVLALFAYLSRPERYMLAASGAFAGLAILNKMPAVFLIPFSLLVISASKLSGEGLGNVGQALKPETIFSIAKIFLALVLVASLVYIALWPSMWVAPVQTLAKLTGDAAGMVDGTQEHGLFTGGALTPDFILYYPMAALIKTTPASLFFGAACLLALGLGLWSGKLTPAQKYALALVAFALLFTLQMTVSAKRSGRYVLPVFPAIDILAALGFWQVADGLGRILPKNSARVTAALAISVLALLIFLLAQVHPYYLAYYDPVLGGPLNGPAIKVMAWGEGMDLAAKYLSEKPGAADMVASVPDAQALDFKIFFKGLTAGMDEGLPSDYLVFYVRDNLHPELVTEYRDSSPEKVITINGVDYCRIYRARPSTYTILKRHTV